jgi:hypothetical protein
VTPSVDPNNIPSTMSRKELEWFILFGICVANKPANITRKKMDDFLELISGDWSPFDKVRVAINAGLLGKNLRKVRFGQYNRINRAFRQVIELNLDNLSVETLESVKGIGPKTARFIILYYKPKSEVVPLDTHVLRWLREHGYNAPKSTPPAGKKYQELEQAFVKEAKKRRLSVKELDTIVWQTYATGQ